MENTNMDGKEQELVAIDDQAEGTTSPEAQEAIDLNNEPELESDESQATEEVKEDKKVSDFVPKSRFNEVLQNSKKLEQELEEIKKQIATNIPPKVETEEEQRAKAEKEQARQALKELGIVFQEDIEAQKQKELEEKQRELENQKNIEAINSQIEFLKKNYGDGKAGVKFSEDNIPELLEYAKKEGFSNFKSAFEHKNKYILAKFWAQQAPQSPEIPTRTPVAKGSAPDFSQMTSDEIIQWQKSQGFAQ